MTYRRVGSFGLLAVALALGLAACGGSKDPTVANLATATTTAGNGAAGTAAAATTGSGNSTTSPPTGIPSQLLADWGACMRSHGDPVQADPTVDVHGLIHISWNPAIPGGYNGTYKGGQGNTGPGQYCRADLQGAVAALQGGRVGQHPSSAGLLKYAGCMRANGFPDFPDPSGSGSLSLNVGSAMSPSNPVFQRASKLCAQKTGVHAFGTGTPPPGTIELNGEQPP